MLFSFNGIINTYIIKKRDDIMKSIKPFQSQYLKAFIARQTRWRWLITRRINWNCTWRIKRRLRTAHESTWEVLNMLIALRRYYEKRFSQVNSWHKNIICSNFNKQCDLLITLFVNRLPTHVIDRWYWQKTVCVCVKLIRIQLLSRTGWQGFGAI